MIALLYGVVRSDALGAEQRGVQGSAVNYEQADELALLYSAFTAQPELPMPESAVEFHGVIQSFVERSEIVPFHFPTWLNPDALKADLERRKAAYRQALERIAGCLQMEVRIRVANETATPVSPSGRDYLMAKSSHQNNTLSAAERVRDRLKEFANEWRTRPSQDGLRLCALVPREKRDKFIDQALQVRLENAEVRISGPWAATEFIDIPHDQIVTGDQA